MSVVRCRSLCLLVIVLVPAVVLGETPAPSLHWGGLAYPDQYTTLTTGFTSERFTEFSSMGRSDRYDSTIDQTIGFNLITLSWTRHWDELPFLGNDWSTNLTLGIGPAAEQPSKFIQNNMIHRAFGYPQVSTDRTREDTDAMVDLSVTKWVALPAWPYSVEQPKVLFGGVGTSLGTVYQEHFIRAGVRRFSFHPWFEKFIGEPPSQFVDSPIDDLKKILGYFRFSAMIRGSLVNDGAVLHNVKDFSHFQQVSVSFGPYENAIGKDDKFRTETPPPWEVEVGLSWDSGIFKDTTGQSKKEYFITGAITVAWFRFEFWDDAVNHKDKGPTGGGTLTIDLCRCGGFKFLCYP